ncbi:MAG: S41 family peptidase [Patescibacteria group bacterium]
MPPELLQRPFKVNPWVIAVMVVVAVCGYGLGVHSGSAAKNVGAANASTDTLGSHVLGTGSKPPKGDATNVDFNQFWDLWQLMETKFYKQPLDEQTMLYGAMQGLAASAGDPYTVFFEPKVAEEFSNSLNGKFEGIGAEIGIKDDQLQVIAPLPDSPAEKAGVLAGDAILMIDATSTDAMTVDQAVSIIRGDKGTSVTLTIGRFTVTKGTDGKEKKEPKSLDITIVRDTIVVKSVKVAYPKDGIALITVTNFNSDTADLFAKAVDEVTSKNVKGVILDLRNDPGGFLDRATAVAGEWVGDQPVVSERRQGKIVDEFRGTGSGKLHGIPTIVLVNEGSASASEIVAGALQDYGEAKLVGKKTFGKGSVQDYTELDNGAAVKITVAEWLTPKGRSINKIGIDPDIVVDRTEEDYHADRDPQLQKAIDLLTGTASSTTSPAKP